MKTKSLLLFMLMALLAPWAANAQTTVEIGDGTSAGYYTPIGTYYNYSITEQLYTADEIGTAGTITSISFNYAYTAAKDFPITVYMANVDAEDLSTGISLADADEVFDGTLSVTGAGWATIDLDTPFAYDGTSNLLIGVNKGQYQWFSGSTWTYTAVANMARYSQNDNNAYDLSTVPGTATNNRPNIQIAITAGSGPVCEKPATMEASNVATTSATLTWSGGSGTYNVEYMGGTVTEWTSYLTNTTATTANLTGLTPGTNYQYRVQSVCTDGVSGWKSVSFMTMFGIPFVEEFGTAIPTGWSMYTGLLDNVMADPTALQSNTYAWSFGTGNNVFDNHARCNIYGNYQKWLVLPTLAMENNVQLMFDLALTVYSSGSSASPEPGAQADDKFIVLIQTDRGWEILRQWDNAGSEYVYDNISNTGQTVAIDLSSYAGQNIAIAFYGESTESGGDNNLHIDNVSIDYIPACAKPTGLAVNYEGGNTARVTWEGEASTYNIDVNGNVITDATSPYTLEDLELATTYAVKVQANCGATDGLSEWTNAVNFTTDFCLPENMCQITLNLADSYGDGWNGAAIGVYDYVDENNNTLLATFTIPSGNSSASYTLDVCDGRTLAFVWGAGSFDSECSYQILDHIGDEILSGSGALETTGYTMNCNSTCRKPTDLAATAGPRSATLSWTENGDATAWVLAYMASTDEDVTYVDVTTNPYVLEGLNTETTYYAMVRSDCDDDEKWSDAIAFTTLESCPAPSQLNITNLKPTSATVNWTGFSDTYDLRYAMAPTNSKRVATNNKPANNWKAKYVNYAPGAVKTKAPIVAFEAAPNSKPVVTTSNTRDGWLQYDDGTMVTGVGNGTTQYEWTWGVMYPASMLAGNDMLSKVSIYETAQYNTQDITINVYTGGDEAPETLVYTETVTPAGVDGFHEITFAEPVTIDPSQNLWITLTETGYYVIAACQGTESNNDWVDNDGWAHIGDLAASLAGYNWMIRGYLETSYDPETLDWTTVNGLNTNSYDITGLDPETTYIVQILGHCTEEDATTNWTQITFTTPSECDDPENLTVVENTTGNSVTLGWDGYQESFNIRYRTTTTVDPTAPATIILTADDVWEDGSGYQMLLDADANTYGELWNANHNILVDGEQYTGGDIPDSYYANFEYKIPERADGALTTEYVVVTGSQTLQIPAGTYDFAIFNPTPGDRFYIAADNGNVGGAEDDFVFEPGVTYEFVMQRVGTGDGAMLTVTRPMSDWETVENVEDIPYTLTGLTPETYYEWQVQGVNEDCTGLEWIDGPSFTTPEITTLTQTITLEEASTWFSTYVDITLDNLKAALVAALPANTTIKIKNADEILTYSRGRWNGSLTWDVAKMYKIIVPTTVTLPIEFTLEGMPLDPSEHSITIAGSGRATWIGFPFSENMTPTNAFAEIAQNGDKVKSSSGNTSYTRGRWQGEFPLEPGKGYIFISNANATDRTLVYPTSSKAVKK